MLFVQNFHLVIRYIQSVLGRHPLPRAPESATGYRPLYCVLLIVLSATGRKRCWTYGRRESSQRI